MDNETGHVTFQTTYAKEFRYDGARQRYLSRDVGTAALYHKAPDEAVWSDYDGNSVYGDYTVTGSVASDTASYEPGNAKISPWVDSGDTSTKYYHTDGLGTTRHMTDNAGAQVEDTVYTAFGEKISGPNQ